VSSSLACSSRVLTHARLSLCCVPQVERELAAYTDAGTLRASVLRPSLVYTPRRPAALPAVGAFWVANSLGIPFIDRPVTVDTLAAAAVRLPAAVRHGVPADTW
jgi:nucleoside-diphosphate-sugar epimerase